MYSTDLPQSDVQETETHYTYKKYSIITLDNISVAVSLYVCLIPRTTTTSMTAPNDYTLQDATFVPVRQSQQFFFKHVRKHTCYACDNKHIPLEYALTSRSFSKR